MIKDFIAYGSRFLKKYGMPLYLIFFTTSKCNSYCFHCFNWQRRESSEDDLTLEEIERISRSMGPLGWLLLTGGEPFLRDDLANIAKLFSEHNRLYGLKLPSNGSLTRKMVDTMNEILNNCYTPRYLGVNLSIDGIGEDHDRIRNFPGLFERAIETYWQLKEMEKKYRQMAVNVTITISSKNQDKLSELYWYLRRELKVTNVTCSLVRGSPREPEALNINLERYREFVDLLERNPLGYKGFPIAKLINAKTLVQRRRIIEVALREKRILPCYAGNISAVIHSNGDVLACEMREPLGNLRENDYDFKKIWFSCKANEMRKSIQSLECWCTHECFINTSIMFNLKLLPDILGKVIRITIKSRRP